MTRTDVIKQVPESSKVSDTVRTVELFRHAATHVRWLPPSEVSQHDVAFWQLQHGILAAPAPVRCAPMPSKTRMECRAIQVLQNWVKQETDKEQIVSTMLFDDNC